MSSGTVTAPGARRLAFIVGAIATGASTAITVLAGLERGGTVAEQWIWMAIGLALLLGAHLIPAIARDARVGARILSAPLWIAAMVSTGYTHGTFFLAAQQHAGDVRAGRVSVPAAERDEASTSGAVSALLRQQARLQSALDQSTLLKCTNDCRALMVRRQTLRTQLDSIKGQLNEARRVEEADDRKAAERAYALARQDAQRGDPVSTKLSGWLGTQAATTDLALAIFFGWLLECIACFSWYVALSRLQSGERFVADLNAHRVTPSPAVKTAQNPVSYAFAIDASRLAANDSNTPWCERNGNENAIAKPDGASSGEARLLGAGLSDEVLLRAALEAGTASNSIADIVRVLGCSESRALALRRQIAATSPRLLVVGAG